MYGYTCRRNMLYGLKCAPSATVFNALKIILIRYHKHFLMQKIESPPPLGRVLESASLYEHSFPPKKVATNERVETPIIVQMI